MFCGCSKLKSITFDNFNTSSVNNMKEMFYDCKYLESLDLSTFNTKSVTSMEKMFSNSQSLISLDLSNFDTSSVINMKEMFSGCSSLIYLNLNSFMEKNNVDIDFILNNINNGTIYCINEEKSPKISSVIKSNNFKNDCENDCFNNNKKKIIINKKICIEKCSNDPEYIYELNNICYNYNPNILDDEQTESQNILGTSENIIVSEISDGSAITEIEPRRNH